MARHQCKQHAWKAESVVSTLLCSATITAVSKVLVRGEEYTRKHVSLPVRRAFSFSLSGLGGVSRFEKEKVLHQG